MLDHGSARRNSLGLVYLERVIKLLLRTGLLTGVATIALLPLFLYLAHRSLFPMWKWQHWASDVPSIVHFVHMFDVYIITCINFVCILMWCKYLIALNCTFLKSCASLVTHNTRPWEPYDTMTMTMIFLMNMLLVMSLTIYSNVFRWRIYN